MLLHHRRQSIHHGHMTRPRGATRHARTKAQEILRRRLRFLLVLALPNLRRRVETLIVVPIRVELDKFIVSVVRIVDDGCGGGGGARAINAENVDGTILLGGVATFGGVLVFLQTSRRVNVQFRVAQSRK